jgi:phosphotransferase system HPr (HPr) family protein
MGEEEIIATDPSGLHAGPARILAETAKGYESDILISYNGKEVSAKSLLKLMKLGVGGGGTVRLCCQGRDEAEAAFALKSLISHLEE